MKNSKFELLKNLYFLIKDKDFLDVTKYNHLIDNILMFDQKTKYKSYFGISENYVYSKIYFEDINELMNIVIHGSYRNSDTINHIFLLLQDIPDDKKIEIIKKRYYYFSYFYKPSEEVCKKALKCDINNIRYIRYPSKEIQNFVIEQDVKNIRYFPIIDDTLLDKAVKQRKFSLSYLIRTDIDNRKQYEIIKHTPNNFPLLLNPDYETIKLAVEKLPTNILHLDLDFIKTHFELLITAIKKKRTLFIYFYKFLTKEEIEKIYLEVPSIIKYIHDRNLFHDLIIKYFPYRSKNNDSFKNALIKNFEHFKIINRETQLYLYDKAGLEIFKYITNPCPEIKEKISFFDIIKYIDSKNIYKYIKYIKDEKDLIKLKLKNS